VGPLGFVLNRQQWLGRYRGGDLVTHELTWDDVEVRDDGGCAVAVGRHTQRASFRGNPADGAFRATHIAVARTTAGCCPASTSARSAGRLRSRDPRTGPPGRRGWRGLPRVIRWAS
jgi:hypothetical protein